MGQTSRNKLIGSLSVGTIGLTAAVSLMAYGRLQAVSSQQSGEHSPSSSHRETLDKYCLGCHNQRLHTAGLRLDTMDLSKVGHDPADVAIWEKVALKLRMGMMPPAGRPRPDQTASDALVRWLETEIDRAAAGRLDPGRTASVHRLNRAEYQNAVRDLLSVQINAPSLLPADDANEHGFDNIADVLSVSPALLEAYISAARKVAQLAVGSPAPVPVVERYRVPLLMFQDGRMSEDLPFGSRGGAAIHHVFPADGEYVIKVRLAANGNGNCIRGMARPHQLDIRVDGARIKQFTVGGESKGRPVPASYCGSRIAGDPEWERYVREADAGLEVRFSAKAGTRVVGVSFLREMREAEDVAQPRQVDFAIFDEQPEGNPDVDYVEIAGPYDVVGPGDTPSRRRIFVCQPARDVEQGACARKILATIARRAYRRPVTEQDIRTILGFYETGRASGGFEAGIELALERMLADPDFLFRIEYDPASVVPRSVYRLSDVDLASRLSFFLWSSIPDDELLDLASRGKLNDPVVLEQQVRRMLADLRSQALVENFAGQWLALRNIRTAAPDADVFPGFDENLREAFLRETELFIADGVRGDRSVVELLSANHTFVNERLARHYGIPNIYGNHFRKVTFADARRGGLLGQGSLLTVTSYPNRTSPVLRGKWLLENILGTPPPPPPPNVPNLPDRGNGGQPASVRARLEEHRKNPVCGACHAPMDPLGFALENFDAIGAWRTQEVGTAIDASGRLPSGQAFEGLVGLRDILLGHRKQFVLNLSEKLLMYALGRGLEVHDLSVIRKITQEASATDYRWSSIVLGIVKSVPFQMRRSES